MTWDEAVKAMRTGVFVSRPGMYGVLMIRRAQRADGSAVDVVLSMHCGSMRPARVTKALRERADFRLATVGTGG